MAGLSRGDFTVDSERGSEEVAGCLSDGNIEAAKEDWYIDSITLCPGI